jgi:hypothetical protein
MNAPIDPAPNMADMTCVHTSGRKNNANAVHADKHGMQLNGFRYSRVPGDGHRSTSIMKNAKDMEARIII